MGYSIVVDTEGVDGLRHSDGKAHGESALFYDFGFIVFDNKTFEPAEKFSLVNTDVFYRNDDLLQTCYYAEKLPQYEQGLYDLWEPMTTLDIYNLFKDAVKHYKVKDIWAYNCRYDMQSTNYTVREMSNGFVKFFTPYGTTWRDIWDYSNSVLCGKKFREWARANNFVKESGNVSSTADTLGKYVLQDLDFEEQHTALSDCEIELAILAKAKKQKKRGAKTVGQGWRYANGKPPRSWNK